MTSESNLTGNITKLVKEEPEPTQVDSDVESVNGDSGEASNSSEDLSAVSAIDGYKPQSDNTENTNLELPVCKTAKILVNNFLFVRLLFNI